jgi:hypothetical protein
MRTPTLKNKAFSFLSSFRAVVPPTALALAVASAVSPLLVQAGAYSSNYGLFIKNATGTTEDLSNISALSEGALSFPTYAVLTSSEGSVTYFYRPNISLKADSFVVISQLGGQSFIGTNSDRSQTASTVTLGSLSEKASGTIFGIVANPDSPVSVYAADSITADIASSGAAYGLYNQQTSVTVSAADVAIRAQSEAKAHAVSAYYAGTTKIEADTLTVSSVNLGGSASGIGVVSYGENNVVQLTAGTINISGDADSAYGILTQTGSHASVGSASSENITVKASSDKAAIGAAVLGAGAVSTIEGKFITISADGAGDAAEYMGVLAQSNTQDDVRPDGSAQISLTSANSDGLITVTSKGLGLAAFSNATLNVTGNLKVTAPDAVYGRGNAAVNINTASDYTTVLAGDIIFATPNVKSGDAHGSGNLLNADVTVRLSGAESSWTGSSYSSYRTETDGVTTEWKVRRYGENDEYFGQVEGFKLTLANGAAWHATDDSFVNALTVEGAGNTIDFTDGQKNLDIRSIHFKADSELITTFATAYEAQADADGVVTEGRALLTNITSEDKESATLSISDKVKSTSAGFKNLSGVYGDVVTVNFLQSELVITDEDRANGVAIDSGTTLSLSAKGAGEDIAGGAELKIAGTISIVADEESGSAEAKLGKATLSEGGELAVAAKLTVDDLSVGAGAKVSVGSDDIPGKLVVNALELKGTLFLDPTWESGAEASYAAVTLKNDTLEGQLVVGRNSKLEIGSDSTAELDAALAAQNRRIAEDDVQAALYINKPVTLAAGGALIVDGTLTEAPADAQSGVRVAKGAVLMVNADAGADGSSVITASGGSLVIEGTLYVDNAVAGRDFSLASGFDSSDVSKGTVKAVNRLITLTASADNPLLYAASPNDDLMQNTMVSETLGAAISGGSGLGADRINALFDATNGMTNAKAAAAVNNIALMGTASGAQAVAVTAAGMMTDTLNRHGSSLAARSHKDAGADLWIALNGSFAKASSYKAGSSTYGFKSDLAGATVGADYAAGNGLAAGAAFTFGTGSARGQGNGHGVKNDIDYYGFHLYGVWSTPYANLIGSVGYNYGKNEIKHLGYKGKPDVKTVSLALRAEKPFDLTENFTVTPHAGIRYLNVDMDSFTAGGFTYSADKANIAQIPLGVSVNGSFKTKGSSHLKPFADFTVMPTFGDRKVTNRFALEGSAASDRISARITNNTPVQGKVGISAAVKNHSLSFSYGLGGGSDGRVDQELHASYRYSF